MTRNLYPIISTFLKLHDADFDVRRLALLLRSHPDPFSINNITDAFDQLQIPNAALEITIEHVPSLSLPVLSMLRTNNRLDFVILTKIDKAVAHVITETLETKSLPLSDFQAAWQPIVIVTDVSDRKKRSFRPLQYINSWPVLLTAAILLIAATISNTRLLLYNLFSLAGVSISVSIFLMEYGRSVFLNRFCSGGGQVSCRSVLGSPGGSLFGVKLADASLLYFATLFLTGVFTPNNFRELASIVSTAALFIVPYSVYYQARVIKKWCTLCIGIITILILQATLTWINEPVFVLPSIQAVVTIAAITVMLAGLGTLAQQQFRLAQNTARFEEEALSFKRNYELFMAAYEKQPMVAVQGFQSPIAYGDLRAPIQLTVVSNPLCEPCADTHHIITRLIQQLPGQVYVQYVFYCNPADDKDQRTVIARKLIALCHGLPPEQQQQLLDHWYKHHKIDAAFADKTITSSNNSDYINKTLEIFHEFRAGLHIYVSPTIILNGRWLPTGYYPDCLPWVLPYCIDRLPQISTTNSSFFLQEKQLQW